jgi:cell wall-associated NlpC family hydrolase
MATKERWLANHAVTELWSGWDEHAIAWTMVPQWSFFQQVEDQQGKRIHVHYYGNSMSKEGDVWVDAQDVGPVGKPARLIEPEWPHPSPPATEPVHVNPNYHPPTAPAIPDDHIPHLAAAARAAQVDVGILAATAACESGFAGRAYREERQLAYVRWRRTLTDTLDRFPDGSLGPTQVLRSNFLAHGIDNDDDAYAPSHNYRVAAMIIRSNFAAFPDDHWKAVAAYNVGQYGAKIGRVPAGGYTDRILNWAKEYAQLFQHELQQPNAANAGVPRTNEAASPKDDPALGISETMIHYGMSLLGTPYVFGGKYIARDKGIDCSGFVCDVLEHCGVHLGNRDYLSAEAIRGMTRSIDRSEARAGDLIFFERTYDTPGASHIGFLVDPGSMLNARERGGVQKNGLQDAYLEQHFLAVGRLPHFDNQPGPNPTAPPNAPTPPPESIVPEPPTATTCSFCGKDRTEVHTLVGAHSDERIAICDGCIKLYADLLGPGVPHTLGRASF